jgi:mono/diheme cytochrome c family protein
MKRFASTLFIALAVFTMLSCGSDKPGNVVVNSVNTSGPAQSPLPAATIDELASGRKVYADNCMACHKENGKGGEVVIEGKKLNPDDLSSAKIKGFSDEKIIGYIMNGVEDEGMPSFKNKLSEGEMRDVVKYVRAEIQKMPAKTAPPPKS